MRIDVQCRGIDSSKWGQCFFCYLDGKNSGAQSDVLLISASSVSFAQKYCNLERAGFHPVPSCPI